MITRTSQWILAAATIAVSSTACSQSTESDTSWKQEFGIANCEFSTTGRNEYFILQPGFQLVLQEGDTKLQITVLDETETVDGVVTRVVEEREWEGDELHEISRNFFAICDGSNDVIYFGEDVDNYKDGKVANHDSAWRAGVDGNKAGLIMPGTPQVKMKYYQEIAPGIAMDRAEIISLDETCETPAGVFQKCMKVKEGSALNIFETGYKYYAPGIGLIQDADLLLTKHGMAVSK